MKPRVSDDLIREQADLITRDVRALALLDTCKADPITMLRIATKIEALAHSTVVPFVLDCGDSIAEYGYAATQWVLDLLR
jgi:hypothetical protein